MVRVSPASTESPTLTQRQQEIAAFIERGMVEGRPPSRGDIATRFGITRATAQQHVVALERHGALRRVPGARGLLPIRSSLRAARTHEVPVLGRVAAGVPLLAVEDATDAVPVVEGQFRQVPDLLLRVAGDSMVGAGILDGDLVAIVLRATADSGEIVVARVNDEITVKRLRRSGRVVDLVAENPAYPPMRITGDCEFAIEGVVVGVLRRL